MGEDWGPPGCCGGYWGCDCYMGRLRTTRDDVVAIVLAFCGNLGRLRIHIVL